MLAGFLNWSQSTFVSDIEIADRALKNYSEFDDGIQCIYNKLPCVVTVDLRLCHPRYISLPKLIQARKKPIQTFEITDIAKFKMGNLKLLKISDFPEKKMGIEVKNMKNIFECLKKSL